MQDHIEENFFDKSYIKQKYSYERSLKIYVRQIIKLLNLSSWKSTIIASFISGIALQPLNSLASKSRLLEMLYYLIWHCPQPLVDDQKSSKGHRRAGKALRNCLSCCCYCLHRQKTCKYRGSCMIHSCLILDCFFMYLDKINISISSTDTDSYPG